VVSPPVAQNGFRGCAGLGVTGDLAATARPVRAPGVRVENARSFVVIFTPGHHYRLRRRAAQAAPLEACGFVMRNGSIIDIRNVAENPYDSFTMDLWQISRQVDVSKIGAIWHTHPNGDIRPSRPDLEAIRLCEWGYIIVSSDEIAWYESTLKAFSSRPDATAR